MTIREIYTAAANHFGVPVHDEEFLRGVPDFHGLRAPDGTRLTVDSELDDSTAETITGWAVDQTAYRAGIRKGIIGRRSRKEARQLGNVHDRIVYDPDTRAAYCAAIEAGIAAVRSHCSTVPDVDHAAALVLNAAMNWENAMRSEAHRSGGLQAIQARLIAEDVLRGEISAYMSIVAGQMP